MHQPGSYSSPEDSTLDADRSRAMVVVETKPRGRKLSPLDCDNGDNRTAKGQADSKIQLRKQPSQTRPCDGKLY